MQCFEKLWTRPVWIGGADAAGKQGGRRIAGLLITLLASAWISGALAAPPDGEQHLSTTPYGEWEITRDGKTDAIHNVLDDAFAEEVRRVGAPPPPIPHFPADRAVIDGNHVVLNWRDGVGEPRAEHFRVCISKKGTLCGASAALKFPALGDAPLVATRLDIGGALPFDWQGDDIVWKVGACAFHDDGYSFNGAGPQEVCTYAPARRLHWQAPTIVLLPPVVDNVTDPTSVTFSWHVDGNSIAYFKFCHRRDFGTCQEPRIDHASDVYAINDPAARQYVMNSGQLSNFEDLPILWEVAACNAADECFWSAPSGYRMPALLGSYAQMMPIFHGDKCMNCHGFDSGNETSQRHINEGRLQSGDDVTEPANCAAAGCHGNSQYPVGWQAPWYYLNFTNHSCNEITQILLNGNRQFMRDHLTTDDLVLWAVDRMPNLTQAGWSTLVDNWYDTFMRCQRDGRSGYWNGQ